MSAEIVNLRRARKAASRDADARAAAANRARHGQTKSARDATRAQADLASRRLDGSKLSRRPDAED
ncbi:MAG: DUF4169 family protein [Rhodospirillales bacterium]|jgi:hypothetical protein